MKRQSIEQQSVVFILLSLVAFVVTFFGLRLFYHHEHLSALLTQTYTVADFQVTQGNAHIVDNDLVVDKLVPGALSQIQLNDLRIDGDLFDSVTLMFNAKHRHQPLTLSLFNEKIQQSVSHPVLYTNGKSARFDLPALFPDGMLITQLSLETRNLISPYRLHAIRFEPKKLTHTAFLQLLMAHFVTNKRWLSTSQQSHTSQSPLLWTPSLLILIYASVTGLLFLLYLVMTRQPILNAWWATGFVAWFVLDAHYLSEKTAIVSDQINRYTWQANEKTANTLIEALTSSQDAQLDKAPAITDDTQADTTEVVPQLAPLPAEQVFEAPATQTTQQEAQ